MPNGLFGIYWQLVVTASALGLDLHLALKRYPSAFALAFLSTITILVGLLLLVLPGLILAMR